MLQKKKLHDLLGRTRAHPDIFWTDFAQMQTCCFDGAWENDPDFPVRLYLRRIKYLGLSRTKQSSLPLVDMTIYYNAKEAKFQPLMCSWPCKECCHSKAYGIGPKRYASFKKISTQSNRTATEVPRRPRRHVDSTKSDFFNNYLEDLRQVISKHYTFLFLCASCFPR